MQTIRIIDGKRYNMETATKIAEWDNGLYGSDFHAIDETLYQTPKGAFFLVVHGGALSPYAQSCGNGTCGGTEWRVMTDDEAFEWLENHHETDALERLFPDKIQDA